MNSKQKQDEKNFRKNYFSDVSIIRECVCTCVHWKEKDLVTSMLQILLDSSITMKGFLNTKTNEIIVRKKNKR